MIDSDVKYIMIMYGFDECTSSHLVNYYKELCELTTHEYTLEQYMNVITCSTQRLNGEV